MPTNPARRSLCFSAIALHAPCVCLQSSSFFACGRAKRCIDMMPPSIKETSCARVSRLRSVCLVWDCSTLWDLLRTLLGHVCAVGAARVAPGVICLVRALCPSADAYGGRCLPARVSDLCHPQNMLPCLTIFRKSARQDARRPLLEPFSSTPSVEFRPPFHRSPPPPERLVCRGAPRIRSSRYTVCMGSRGIPRQDWPCRTDGAILGMDSDETPCNLRA